MNYVTINEIQTELSFTVTWILKRWNEL